jgi:hypothetical protein
VLGCVTIWWCIVERVLPTVAFPSCRSVGSGLRRSWHTISANARSASRFHHGHHTGAHYRPGSLACMSTSCSVAPVSSASRLGPTRPTQLAHVANRQTR